MKELTELIAILVFVVALPMVVTTLLCIGVASVDYHISSEATVNAINKQCGTNYRRSDYLRIGTEAMLQMCETREKRIELKR